MITTKLALGTLTVCFVALITFGCGGLGRIEIDTKEDLADLRVVGRPMGHQTIYLLRNSIASPEMEDAFKRYMAATTPPVNTGIPLKPSEVRTRAGFMMSDGRAIWHKYIIESAETGYDGKALFRKVKAGDYWLYCIRRTPAGEWRLWNVKTTVPFYDTTKVTISNDNITFK